MLHPGMNGLRFKLNQPDHAGKVFLMDQGKARHVTTGDAMNRLFENWDGIQTFDSIPGLEFGATIDDRGSTTWKWMGTRFYWTDPPAWPNPTRRIMDHRTISRYNFRTSGIHNEVHEPTTGLGPELYWMPIFNGYRVTPDNTAFFAAPDVSSPPGPLPPGPIDGKIFLIDQNQKRHIVDPPTYDALFVGGSETVDYLSLERYPTGPDITAGTRLVSGHGGVYLLDSLGPQIRIKRHVANPDAMNYYGFNWNKIGTIDQATLDRLVTGPEIQIG